MREQSVFSVLENNGFIQKSITEIKNQSPAQFDCFKNTCLELELYTLLEWSINKEPELYKQFSVWFRNDLHEPLVLQRCKKHDLRVVKIISDRTCIPYEEFLEVHKQTSLN